MKNADKYTRGYFLPPVNEMKWARRDYIDHPPTWCSVDLRDGNQALIVPMQLEEKLEFFTFLCALGFKEIEVGFPAASQTEFDFLRALIERGLIPEDVTVQVLTQSRPHIIEKTFDALRGARRAIVHLYNSTSVAQREQVFCKSREEIIEIAVSGAALIAQRAARAEGEFLFEYSPESFTGTEMDFALDICNRVLDVWRPTPEKKAIVNLPVTVQLAMPHVYAGQVEYISDRLSFRENVILSLHPHNDRGCAVADCELGLLAGAQRIEGTLFGNGERTGNADLITLALNMYAHGVDPRLDLANMPGVVERYERFTGMHVYERQPYGGELVFAAFSGSHQDAIAKGMKWREKHDCAHWNVPYLPIDPQDIGRTYDGDVIRINSQSGKGGIGFVLQKHYGFDLPPKMREAFGYLVKDISDRRHEELQPCEIHDIFRQRFVNLSAPLRIEECHFTQGAEMTAYVTLARAGYDTKVVTGKGNGRLDAVSNALGQSLGLDFSIAAYQEHALQSGSNAQACAYVGIECPDTGKPFWGAGIHEDIITASIHALLSAVNNCMQPA